MSSRLIDNLSSDYIQAANRLRGRNARQRIVAHVASYDDVFFWRTVLSGFEDQTHYFEVMLPSHEKLGRGKKAVLMNLLKKKVGRNMIACVDADYDYLLQGATPMSQMVCNNPYVFHTYVYAIENFQCYAQSLHDVCVAVTLNDHALFDFESYLHRFSKAIYPLFVWSVLFYRKGKYAHFTLSDFNQAIELGRFSLERAEENLLNVQRKVQRKVNSFAKEYAKEKTEYQQLSDQLASLGVTPETTYLYIQGHHLFDGVVVPMMEKVCERLVREREREICRTAIHSTQRRNELSCYDHSISETILMLRRNTGYKQSPPFQLLQADISRFMEWIQRPNTDATLSRETL